MGTMLNLQPIKRPINNSSYEKWNKKNSGLLKQYDNFVKDMLANGVSEVDCDIRWEVNFGPIPASPPERIYQCNILDQDLKIVVDVIRRNNAREDEPTFEILGLNHLYLTSYDYIKKMTAKDGVISFEKIYKNEKDLASGYPINYEDSGWFTNMAVDTLLSKLKITIPEYKLLDTEEIPKKPTFNLIDLESMDTTSFDIDDPIFKAKLYSLIMDKFENILDELQ